MSHILSQQDAVQFAHALASYVARTHGLRVMSIKGFTLAHHGLRRERTYADADIWVAPGDLDAFTNALRAYGWRERFEYDVARILVDHSRTLIHQKWPCDIDVHWYFPGAFEAPEVCFESIWATRQTCVIAGQPAWMPDYSGSALIGALHCLRYPRSSRHRAELEEISTSLSGDAAPHQRQAFSRLLRETRSVEVVGAFAQSLGIELPEYEHDANQMSLWNRYVGSHESGSTAAWLYAIREAPWSERPRLIKAALFPGRAEVVKFLGGDTSLSARVKFYVQRFARAIRAVVVRS